MQVRRGVAFCLDLLQRLAGRAVQLELEDVDVIVHLQRAVHAAEALAILATDGKAIDTHQAQKQVEGVLEMLLGQLQILQRAVGIVGNSGEKAVREVRNSEVSP